MINDKYFTMKISVLLEDGSYNTVIRKIKRSLLTDIKIAKTILDEESKFGVATALNNAYKTLVYRSGLKTNEEIKTYINNRFNEEFSGFNCSLVILDDRIVISDIRYNDWFIPNIGINSKYPILEDDAPFGELKTSIFVYVKEDRWTYFRTGGGSHFEPFLTQITPPFNHNKLIDFIGKIKNEGYNLTLSPVHIYSTEETEKLIQRKNENNDCN